MSYGEFEGDPYPDPDRVELYLGVEGPESFAAHDADNSTQPAGAGFRDLVWTPPNLGKVRITSHYTNLDLDHVFLAMGIIFARINDGVNKISINGSHVERIYVHFDEKDVMEKFEQLTADNPDTELTLKMDVNEDVSDVVFTLYRNGQEVEIKALEATQLKLNR